VSPPTPRLEVGRIGKAHGLRGEVVVHLLTDRVERVEPGSHLFTDAFAEAETLVVRSSRPQQKGYIVEFEGVSTRERAEALRGSLLYAPALEGDDDTLWVHELVGRRLVEIDGTDRGTVVEVEANPASDLLVTEAGHLVPLAFMVELSDERIVIDPPQGLFELVDGDSE
jgi:16S rRNA processing protein RimM